VGSYLSLRYQEPVVIEKEREWRKGVVSLFDAWRVLERKVMFVRNTNIKETDTNAKKEKNTFKASD